MSADPNPVDSAYLEIFFLRHGQSKAQTEEETGLDTSLSDTGRKQVRDAAEALAVIPFDRICASPLARARESAEIVISSSKRPISMQIDHRLQENTGLPEDFPQDRAESLWQDLCHMAVTDLKVRRVLLVSHAMFGSTFLDCLFNNRANSKQESGIYARLGNARMGWIRIPRQQNNLKILAGWNFSAQELQNSSNGSFY